MSASRARRRSEVPSQAAGGRDSGQLIDIVRSSPDTCSLVVLCRAHGGQRSALDNDLRLRDCLGKLEISFGDSGTKVGSLVRWSARGGERSRASINVTKRPGSTMPTTKKIRRTAQCAALGSRTEEDAEEPESDGRPGDRKDSRHRDGVGSGEELNADDDETADHDGKAAGRKTR